MPRLLFILILFFTADICFSQNVGQKGGDTAVWNYTDINKMKQGKWLKFDSKTKKKLYEGFFINNRPVGLFKRFHPNGKESAVMYYEKGGEHIRVKFYYDTGIMAAEGVYARDNVKDSAWNFYGTDKALMAKESYKEGVKHGMSIKYYRAKTKDGEPIKSEEIEYKDGKKDGIWKQYYESGKIKLNATYSNDLVEGLWTYYFESGKIYITGKYIKSLKEGIWYYFEENGKKTEIEYVNGIPKNKEELDLKFTKELEELEKNSKNLKDPEKMMNQPEQYFMGQ